MSCNYRCLLVVFALTYAVTAVVAQGVGSLGLNAACNPNSTTVTCQPGLYCNRLYRKCAAQQSLGSPCSYDRQCVAPSLCTVTSYNATTGVAYSSCQEPGVRPYFSYCYFSPAATTDRCAPWLTCNNASPQPVCVPRPTAGAPCNPLVTSGACSCQSNFWCPAFSQVCTNKLSSGTCSSNNQCISNVCTSQRVCAQATTCVFGGIGSYGFGACGTGYYCNTDTGFCQRLLAAGDSCRFSSQCSSGLCSAAGYCAQCTLANEASVCGFGRFCNINSAVPACRALIANGANEPCFANSHCASNYCLNGICTYSGQCVDSYGCVRPDGTYGWCSSPTKPNPGPIIVPLPPSFCGGPSYCSNTCSSPCSQLPLIWDFRYPWCGSPVNPFDAFNNNFLVIPSPPTPVNPAPWTWGVCLPYFNRNAFCLTDWQCGPVDFCSPQTNRCTPACYGATGTPTATCPVGYVCPSLNTTDYRDCLAQAGTPCVEDVQCNSRLICDPSSGNCNLSLVCSAVANNTCAPPGTQGAICTRNAECDYANLCIAGTCRPYNTTQFCVSDNQCVSGVCNLATRVCVHNPGVTNSTCARDVECLAKKCDPVKNKCL